jgi:hypothetical protein
MAGTWSGTTTDSNIGQQKMTWTLNQEGGVVSGTFSLGDNGSLASNGTLRATMAGRLIGFHLEIQGGGFGGVMSSCSMTVDGQASVSDDGRTLTGSYSSSMSGTLSGSLMGEACGGSVNDGRFTLTR